METHQAEMPDGDILENLEELNSRSVTNVPSFLSVEPQIGTYVGLETPLETFNLDPGLEERRKQIHEYKLRNKERKVRFKKILKKETRMFGVMRRELASLLKVIKKVQLSNFPRDHYCAEQVALVVSDLLRKVENRSLSYEHMRENIEILFNIQDFCEPATPHTATKIAHMIENLLTIVEEVANTLEEAANESFTKWDLVRSELKIQDDLPPLDAQHMIPMIRHFQQVKLLGAGGFGAVYKAFYRKCLPCTVKLVPIKKFKADKHACVDKVTASVANHPFLVKYFSTFTTGEAYVTIMEYIRGVDLHKILKAEGGLDESTARVILFQLGEAVLHMHSRGFIHRDIKPSNMMLIPGCKLKLIDLDTIKICLANFLPRTSQFYYERSAKEFRDRETAGTVPFLSPEVLKGHSYGRAVDWWAIGVTAFNLVFAKIPFRGEKKSKEYKELVSSAPIPFPSDKQIQPDLQKFIEDCLVRKAALRICSIDNRDFRDHPLFMTLDVNGLYSGSFRHELPSIYNELEFGGENWSPPGINAKNDQRVTLEVGELTDIIDHCRLFTYCSPAFQRCIQNTMKRLKPLEEHELVESEFDHAQCDFLLADPCYRFENYTKHEKQQKRTKS